MMSKEHINAHDPRIRQALVELKAMVRERWPGASFEVSRGEDPEGIYLDATVDVADTDEVMDVVIDRLLELQVEERLPIYVIAGRPLERVLASLSSAGAAQHELVGSVSANL